MWTGFMWLRIRGLDLIVGSCEHGTETSGSIKDGEFD
jgi:hypothetical protein